MAFCRFMVLEPQGDRAKKNAEYLQKVMECGAKKNASGGVDIQVSATSLDTSKKENNFGMVDLMLSMSASASIDSVTQSAISAFAFRLNTFIKTLESLKSKNYGFYWDFYAPYFIEMKEKNFTETFSHLASASMDDKDNTEWLHSHKNEIDTFYDWSKGFQWKQN